MAPLGRLRRPEYTGRNRCWPCTVLNGGILAIVAVSLALVHPLAAVAVAVGGGLAIWLRGYLIPFTPSLGPRVARALPGDGVDHGHRGDDPSPVANRFAGRRPGTAMDTDEVEALIEAELPDAEATVRTPRDPDDDEHFAVEVVSPAFAGKSLVDQHQLVHDALEGHLTRDIHAIELRTRTPDEAE